MPPFNGQLSQEFKNLYINMVCHRPDTRFEISYILDTDPWLEEIRNLAPQELQNLEGQIVADFNGRGVVLP